MQVARLAERPSAAGGSPWRRHCTAAGTHDTLDCGQLVTMRSGSRGPHRRSGADGPPALGQLHVVEQGAGGRREGVGALGLAEVEGRPVPLDARGDPVVAGVQAGGGRCARWRGPAPSRPGRCSRPRRRGSCRSRARPARPRARPGTPPHPRRGRAAPRMPCRRAPASSHPRRWVGSSARWGPGRRRRSRARPASASAASAARPRVVRAGVGGRGADGIRPSHHRSSCGATARA